ncbi:hypothetical protein CN423_25100 [Bacillus cereus]|nr:hypothetical protein CON41_30845 [Bacillus cereus]PEC71766.1 hypothetical protein CON25_20940 [Bacillus thuringiensis]RGP96990.1 hypothetical protein D1166_26650 [Bacillus sp. ISO11]PDZ54333.1 hypothetical protein CON15_27365 [Bacillus cereus]PEC99894.1 hypothetical protein CON14_26810 [Bacillus cereus]
MMSDETLSYVSSDCIFYLFLVRNLLIDFALFYLMFNKISVIFLRGKLVCLGIKKMRLKNTL